MPEEQVVGFDEAALLQRMTEAMREEVDEPIVMTPAIPAGTAMIQVDPSKDLAVMDLHNHVLGLWQVADCRTVASVEDIAVATDDLGLIAKLKKAIEAKRKEYVDPINAHLKAVNEAFKALVAPLEKADTVTRSKIMECKQAEAKRVAEIAEINRLRQEAARKEAALNDGELSEPTQLLDEAPAPPARVHGQASTLGTMKVRKWDVEDFSKVSDEYKIIDSARVGRVVRAGIPSIPGIRIWEEETLAVRGR